MSNVEQELVSKWEQSGLLEQTVNKTSMAKLLEAAAVNLIKLARERKPEEDSEGVFSIIPMTALPILQRGFRETNFEVNNTVQQNNSFTVLVDIVSEARSAKDESWPIKICQNSGKAVADSIRGLINPVVTSVDIVPNESGYNLIFGLA